VPDACPVCEDDRQYVNWKGQTWLAREEMTKRHKLVWRGDLGLPGMTGRQLMEEALRLNPKLKVIIASGYASERDAGGMPTKVAHLMKPFDIEQLRRALES